MNSASPTSLSDAAPPDAAPPRYLEVPQPGSDSPDSPAPSRRPVWLCAPNQVVARIVDSPAPRTPHAILIPMVDLKLGRNVAWDASATAVRALKTGHIVVQSGTLSVAESLELDADVDAAFPIDFPGDVFVHRSILDLAKLTARGNVTVNGAIEAAEVSLTGDLLVHHGICGKERGRIRAKGSVQARFLSNAHVTADGDVRVQNEVANSRILCGGQFRGENASILSSHITALTGIFCDSAGSTAGFRTILELGLDPAELERIGKIVHDLTRKRDAALDIRSKVEPLLKNQKTLTAQQKEKATELLFMADEADALSRQAALTLQPARRQIDTAMVAEIRVHGTLHAGVIIRCLGCEMITPTALRGPIRLTLRIAATGAQFLITDPHNKSLGSLPANTTDACGVARQLQLVGI